ncbi:MAG: YdcF family protein [Methyloceanibacter sp.]
MTTLFLTKLLPLFVYPLGAAILVGATALALSFTSWRRIGQVLLGLALVALWIAATPVCANWLNLRLESQFPPVSVEMLPQSDVVIVLGGALGQPLPPRVELGGPTSRIMEALRIYRAGKAPLIVISGGNLPWQATVVPESQLIADLLVELGAPRSALILETGSRNTRENAVNTAAIFKEHGWRTGLLVTSGTHMPRALAAFQKLGLDVTPAATDIHARPLQFVSLLDLLPDAGALAGTTLAVKEMMGLCIYRLRGWA